MSEYTRTSIFACLPRTTRGVAIVLGGDPKGKNFLYTHGNNVIIRDIANPEISDIYTEHSYQTSVAQYSPSGFYIASGDVSGKIRIWDTVNKEHILKNEFQPIAGVIKDLSWSGDNQRIVAVGEGREKFGHVFNADTGTSVGEIMGQSKAINSCDFRKDRPMRIVTASEDNTLAYFEGPPFKFKSTMRDHSRFVNVVRYSPTGDVFISGSADMKSFIYDGKTGELKGELGAPAHKGGIYGLSFNADGSQVLTVSADKTAKIWDVATSTAVTEFTMGTTIDDQQVGCLWQGEHILSVSLSGSINYLDKNNPNTPIRVLHGHNKPMTAMALSDDRTHAFTGSSDGLICSWNLGTGVSTRLSGTGHKSQVQDIVCVGDELVSVGMDDTIVYSSAADSKYIDQVKMPSQPRSVAAAAGGLVVVACINEIVVLRQRRVVYSHKVDYEPLSVAIHPGQGDVAVGAGSNTNHNVYVYTLSGDTLTESHTLTISEREIVDLSYSPDGATLAAGDANRRIVLYKLPDYTSESTTGYSMHQAKINSVSWTPDSNHLATGSLDTNILIWKPEKPLSPLKIKQAHPTSAIARVAWIDNNRLASIGHDSCLAQWDIKH